jgi:hypothetical protein
MLSYILFHNYFEYEFELLAGKLLGHANLDSDPGQYGDDAGLEAVIRLEEPEE